MSSTLSRRPSVLVADDNLDILKLLRLRLRLRGYDIVTAENGREALEMVHTRRPDAVVLDWVMPVMDGLELCQELRQNHETSGIPVIMLTARANEDEVAEALRNGATEYLTKPFDVDELDQVLKRLLRASRCARTREWRWSAEVPPRPQHRRCSGTRFTRTAMPGHEALGRRSER